MNALLMNELEEIPVTEVERQRFQVVDLTSLNWTLRKMNALAAKKSEVNQLADAEIARIEDYRKRELEALKDSEDFFRGLIGEYATRKRIDDPNFKSEKTPYGSIGFRKKQPKWNYDDAKLVDFLNENELYGFVRVKEEPDKILIKKAFKVHDGKAYVDGQEVEGITVEEMTDELVVNVE